MALPKLCLHSTSLQWYVKIHGKRHYLGRDQIAAEKDRVRLLAELAAGDGVPRPPRGEAALVAALVNAYLEHCRGHYRKLDGSQTSEYRSTVISLRPLVRLYGHLPADEFTAQSLKTLLRAMADGSWMNDLDRKRAWRGNWSRKVVNQAAGRVRRCFKYGVSERLVPAAVLAELAAVRGLQAGRSTARETPPVQPVPQAILDATLPYLSPTVRAMVEVQLLTGARPGELCRLRPCDLDRTGERLAQLAPGVQLGSIWAYLPEGHKTAHHGHRRIIPVGPKAQQVLDHYLRSAAPDGYLFSAAAAEADRLAWRRANRTTPHTPSSRARRPKPDPKKKPGDYTPSSYAHAIAKACRRAGVAHWHPHQLRHNAATRLAQQFGWDVARIVCGHSSLAVTKIYVADDLAKAFRAMGEAG